MNISKEEIKEKIKNESVRNLISDELPIHDWFNLSYSNYLVLPRSILQSMPIDWQRKFVLLIDEIDKILDIDDMPNYRVLGIDKKGKFVRDKFSNYERGRRKVDYKQNI